MRPLFIQASIVITQSTPPPPPPPSISSRTSTHARRRRQPHRLPPHPKPPIETPTSPPPLPAFPPPMVHTAPAAPSLPPPSTALTSKQKPRVALSSGLRRTLPTSADRQPYRELLPAHHWPLTLSATTPIPSNAPFPQSPPSSQPNSLPPSHNHHTFTTINHPGNHPPSSTSAEPRRAAALLPRRQSPSHPRPPNLHHLSPLANRASTVVTPADPSSTGLPQLSLRPSRP